MNSENLTAKQLELIEKTKEVLLHDREGDPLQRVATALTDDIEVMWEALGRAPRPGKPN